MSKLVGYARVSTQDQELQLQLDALEKAGCEKDKIFVDKISGAKTERPGLEKCLSELIAGDTLIVWRLDRLGRSMHHLILLIEDLRNKGIGFKSICDGDIDPEWIESLNSVLDDNHLLTLPTGERISFGTNVNFIFETADLVYASPATVSRMGMIFLNNEDLPIKSIVQKWLSFFQD